MNILKTGKTLAILTVLVCALLASATAHAIEARPPLGIISPGPLGRGGLAVDQANGDVYSAELNGVNVSGAEGGSPVGGGPSQITGEETPGGAIEAAISTDVAVDSSCYLHGLTGTACRVFDPSNGDVYVTNEEGDPNAVDKFKLNGSKYEYVCQFTSPSKCLPMAPSDLGKPRAVTVDRDGNVYVAFDAFAPHPQIVEYNAEGDSIATIASTPIGSLAVDARGNLYGAEEAGTHGALVEFRRGIHDELLPEETVDEEALNVAYDPFTEHLFVTTTDNDIEELNSGNEVIGRFGSRGYGVAVNDEKNEVYEVEFESGALQRFGPPVVLADVSTGGTARVHHNSATVEGVLTPQGLATKYFFQYGETEAYGSSTTPESTSFQAFASAGLEGLGPGKTYHYRLVAENVNGPSYGEDRTFTTPLAVDGVVTGAAAGIGSTGATLTGTVEPDGEDAQAWFEYGLSEGVYGTATAKVDEGSVSEAVPAEAPIASLQPHQTYYYRLAAENAQGISYGSPQKLTTRAAPAAFDGAPSVSNATRAGALVTGAVNPENSATTVHVVYVDEAGYAPGSGEPYAAGASTPEVEAGSGFGDVPVAQPIGGLEPGTTYHYAIVARNQAGTSTSADGTFTSAAGTPPVVSTGSASGVGANSATLTGTVVTEGLPSSYGFQVAAGAATYGPPSGLGSVGAGAGEEAVSLTLVGLLPGVTYRYRITASNLDGTSYGAEQTFTTAVAVGALSAPLGLPLVSTPPSGFPTGSEANTATPPVKHKGKRKKHKDKVRRKGKRSMGARNRKEPGGKGKGSKGRRM